MQTAGYTVGRTQAHNSMGGINDQDFNTTQIICTAEDLVYLF